MKETLTNEVDNLETKQAIEELVGDFFVIDKESDPDHDIYKGKCSACGNEFSVHVTKGFNGKFGKELDQITEEILQSKKCVHCRDK